MALSLVLDTPALAQHYEEVSLDRQFAHGKKLIERLGIAPGERALDVGSGTGLLAEHAARIVGPSGSVVGIDPLPLRIEIAQRKAGPNLSFRVGSAEALDDFADQSFDVVFLNAVFHWLPEKLTPLRHFYRLLKPGGRLGITTGSREHPNTIQVVRQRVLAREPYSQYPEIQGAFGHHVSVGELERLFEAVGFHVKSVALEPNIQHHSSAEALIEFSEASSFGNYLGHLPEALRAGARQGLLDELEALRTADGIRQEGVRIVAVAVKPGT